MSMETELFSTYDALNEAMQAAYTAKRRSGGDEQSRRKVALQSIDETLEWRPLSAFSADQLEFLELLIAYWRELEITVNAPGPDAAAA